MSDDTQADDDYDECANCGHARVQHDDGEQCRTCTWTCADGCCSEWCYCREFVDGGA